MLFNSHEFLFVFLPIAFLLFWYGGHSLRWRLGLLTLASYFFYSCSQFETWAQIPASFRIHSWDDLGRWFWQWRFTLVMLASSSVDYWAARGIVATPVENKALRKLLLALSLAANLGLLAFFKYFGFFESIVNDLIRFAGGAPLPIVAMVLPVGISFYTFESMSYVIDIYKGIAKPARSYLDYACFISFFPHLVAGPIIRYSDILHQFQDTNWVKRRPDWGHVNTGLMFLTFGMCKKILIADPVATWVNPLWEALRDGGSLGVVDGWAAVLGYTFRIYFDFSGYSDMAIGLGHLFAVQLPQNFDSPYKAADPSDFWRRWHISLSTWLRDYLYIPLGGNRGGKQARNLMLTMLLGGLWHGAAWLFVIWGGWHGLMLVVFHRLKRRGWWPSPERTLGLWTGRQITFLGVVVGWIFFRAADVEVGSYGLASIMPAFRVFGALIGLDGWSAHQALNAKLWPALLICWVWCNFVPNTDQVIYGRPARPGWQAILGGATLALCVLRFGVGVDFLYFRF